MTKGHNFVKNKKTKNSKKHSAKFQVNSIKDVAGVAGTRYESARAITSSKNAETKNQKPHAHLHMIRRKSIKFQICPMKDIRGVEGTRSEGQKGRRNEGQTDGRMHTGTDRGHFYSLPLPMLGDKNGRVAPLESLSTIKVNTAYKHVYKQ